MRDTIAATLVKPATHMKIEDHMLIKTGYAQQWNDTEFRGVTLL
jgi:hypothetical protein